MDFHFDWVTYIEVLMVQRFENPTGKMVKRCTD